MQIIGASGILQRIHDLRRKRKEERKKKKEEEKEPGWMKERGAAEQSGTRSDTITEL